MRYAIFTDIHANLEALEAVLAKIDELAQEEPIEQIWFLGDLVGYGPNPNECIDTLRARTDVIIAGNHDWAAVGKIDLEDFSEAARISAEWTAKQLTEEHREFLTNLPERLDKDECTLVHGSPYGPLWEYLTTEVLAERSFEYFNSHYCFVGHTHVPVIFQQPDVANTPTIPLTDAEQHLNSIGLEASEIEAVSEDDQDNDDETQKIAVIRMTTIADQSGTRGEQAHSESSTPLDPPDVLGRSAEIQHIVDDQQDNTVVAQTEQTSTAISEQELAEEAQPPVDQKQQTEVDNSQSIHTTTGETGEGLDADQAITPEETILNAEDRLNQEIEDLLALLGLTQNMVALTNEMILPPEGHWELPRGYRAIVNPGGVGQPRDGDARAAFMIYDPERGFDFYRVPYAIEKTQEKIIEAGLPKYLATRLSYGR